MRRHRTKAFKSRDDEGGKRLEEAYSPTRDAAAVVELCVGRGSD